MRIKQFRDSVPLCTRNLSSIQMFPRHRTCIVPHVVEYPLNAPKMQKSNMNQILKRTEPCWGVPVGRHIAERGIHVPTGSWSDLRSSPESARHVRSTTTHDTHTSIVTIASGPMHLSGRGDGIRDRITHSNSNSSSRRERTQQLARQRYGREARARAHGAPWSSWRACS
jgi:hypothetical protein